MQILRWAVLCLVVFVSGVVSAAPPSGDEEIYPSDAVLQRIKVEESITPETTQLLGERIDLASGALTFNHTDFVLSGGGGLDIVISRSWRGGRDRVLTGSMGDWWLELPRIQTKVVRGGTQYSGSWGMGKECSGEIEPWPFNAGGTYLQTVLPEEYYNGVNLIVPGKTQEQLKKVNSAGIWQHYTQSNWRLRCIARADGGEGFVAQSPDGLEYTFDQRQMNVADVIRKGFKPISIYDLSLYVSKIKDRFGNEINFDYTNGTQITATDGRSVSIQFNTDGVISSINSAKGTWAYHYTKDGYGRSHLSRVTLPDNQEWELNLDNLVRWGDSLYDGGSVGALQCIPSTLSSFGTLKNPYGVTGEFTLLPTHQGRTGVPTYKRGPNANGDCFVSLSLKQKTLKLPGQNDLTWVYSYSQNAGAHSDEATAVAPSTGNLAQHVNSAHLKTTSISAPDGSKSVHQYLRNWDVFEGTEVRSVYVDTDGATLLRTRDVYSDQGSCKGYNGIIFENIAPSLCNVRTTKIVVTEYGSDGGSNTFTTEYSAFNSYDTPTVVKESNSVNAGWVKYTRAGYQHNDAELTNYLLVNLPTTQEVSSDGSSWTTVNETTYYSATGGKPLLPMQSNRFGVWTNKTTQYHSTGEPQKVEYNALLDGGLNRWVTFENYFRGSPQLFTVPHPLDTGSTLTAAQTISDDGSVESTRDFEGTLVGYGYDAMGRLSLKNLPAGWNDVGYSFSLVTGSEAATLGLSTSQFKRVKTQGNLKHSVYFDGLFQPILESKQDTGSSTTYYQRRQFDAYGRVVFESYWSLSAAEAQGTTSQYDGLGRLTKTQNTVDSTASLTEYLSASRVKVTDPRNNITTTTYKAFGQPSTDMPVTISAPEGVTTTLSYNLFGKTEAVSQGGITQHYYYDNQQRLCRTNRPEFGDDVYFYSPGGQLEWEARGQSLAGSGCQHAAIAENQKIRYYYNNLGKLISTDFPDTTPDISFGYTPNGLLATLNTADGVHWTYHYNALGLLEDETLALDGKSFFVDYRYNSNGNMQSTLLPSGIDVAYQPDAFGRPTQVGGYASAITYYPNDLVHSFSYGNGLMHTSTLNSRQLPELRQDVNAGQPVFAQTAGYDAALNINSLIDGVDAHYNLNMTYDGLDRLDTVIGAWGLGSIGYDSLGNIEDMTLGDWAIDHHYDANNKLATVTGSRDYVFNYDNRGNVTANGSHNFTYNLSNQMVSSGAHSYRYDGHDKRVKQTVNGKTSYAMYNQAGQLIHKVEDNATASGYLYLGSRLVAKDSRGVTVLPAVAPALTVPSSASADGQHSFSWTAVANATYYLLQEEVSANHWQALAATAVLAADGQFYRSGAFNVRVAACNAVGCGPYANGVVNVLFPPSTPATISVPSGVDVDGSFTVSWASATDAANYVLEEQVNTGAWQAVATQAGTSKALSGRNNGNYNYRVKACNGSGCSGWKTSTSFSVLLAPSVPASISVPTATDVDGNYSVSWAAAATATSYQLEEQINGGTWQNVATQAAMSKALSGRVNGSYSYRVNACNSSGCSGWKTSTSFSVLLAPSVPASISVPTGTDVDGSYSVSWAGVSTATSYQLEEQINGGAWQNVATQSSTSKALSGRANGSYSYRVNACNSSGCSGWKTSTSFSVLLAPSVPASISVPTGTDVDGSYSVSWAGVSTATSYQLEEQINGGAWQNVATQSSTSKALSGRANGSYSYRVNACNSSGCSGWKTSTSFSVLLAPSVPASISVPTATDVDGSFDVSWSSSTTATSYILKEQQDGAGFVTVATQSGLSKSLGGRSNGSFQYSVQACNASGCSDPRYSTTFSVLLPPGQPTLGLPSADGDGSFTMSWGAVTTSSSYQLQQKTGAGSWGALYTGASTSHAVAGLAEGAYSYQVRACNASGCGAWSSQKTVTVTYPKIISFNKSPSALIRAGSFTASWDSSNATHCILRQNGSQMGGNQPVSGSATLWASSNSTVQITCFNDSQSASSSFTMIVKYGGGGGL